MWVTVMVLVWPSRMVEEEKAGLGGSDTVKSWPTLLALASESVTVTLKPSPRSVRLSLNAVSVKVTVRVVLSQVGLVSSRQTSKAGSVVLELLQSLD